MLSLEQFSIPDRLHPLTVQLSAGTLVGLLGPNGSGKSSLLSGIAGLLRSRGTLTWGQEDIRQWSMAQAAVYRAMLPQRSQYPLSIACYQVLLMAFAPLQASVAQQNQALEAVCAVLELETYLARDFSLLSGGEQQRILLAKTLLQVWPALNPQGRFLLLDEPLAGLDWYYQIRVLELLRQLADEGLTIITSLHDFNLAVNYMPVIWCLADRSLQFADTASRFSEAVIERCFRLRTTKVVTEQKTVFLPASPHSSAGKLFRRDT